MGLEPADATCTELLRRIGQRFSIGPRHLALPAPTSEELQIAAALAARAPDHRRLQPFRFVRVADVQRERLGALFAAAASRRGSSPVAALHAATKAHNGPALVAIVARVRDDVDGVPVHEQWITVGGGLLNFLNALHVMGFGAKVLSGPLITDANLQLSFCQPGEQLVAWVLAGSAVERNLRGGDCTASTLLTDWRG
jgi:nitroreductase